MKNTPHPVLHQQKSPPMNRVEPGLHVQFIAHDSVVPTEFTNEEFKQVLDHNKIKHAKAERMKSKRDGRTLQMFQI